MPETKRANIEIQKLKNALAYAEAIIDAIHEPLVVLRPDLRIRTANDAFYKTFHVNPEETEEKLIYELADGQLNFPQIKLFFQKNLGNKISFKDFEIKYHFKKVGRKTLLLNARKLLMEGEKEQMILLVIEDITDKRRYQEQIEKEKNMLAENQRLQEISRQKDDFISMASHELKTPVTSIKAFAQLLEHDYSISGNSEAAQMLARMNKQIVKLTSLIGDLLDVPKMEGGKLQYHLDYFDFNEMVGDIVREMQMVTKFHYIKVQLVKVPKVYGDRDRVGQVLTNLLSNAIKYSPNTKDIEVSSWRNLDNVCVSVKDHGIGISKHKQAKIFDRFFRENGLTENTYPGLGLGLYIASEILKRHEGSISVTSKKGFGSTFYFTMPIRLHHGKRAKIEAC